MKNTTNAAKDPRCPYCGRPVIGEGVLGNEGLYHRECVQPPNTRRVSYPATPTPPYDPMKHRDPYWVPAYDPFPWKPYCVQH